MTYEILIILILLQIKHWYIDFVNQSDEEVNGKAIYGNLKGIGHSAKHGIATMLIFTLWLGPVGSFLLGLIDFVIHYHTDWLKMNYGNRDVTTPAFWNHLGLDQMVHQITYILLAYSLLPL